MSNHEPQDRVLSWGLPLLPAMIAFVLLCLLLASSERMLADELQQHARAQVKQSSRLFAEYLSHTLARHGAAHAWSPSGAAAAHAPMPSAAIHTNETEGIRRALMGSENGIAQFELAVVDAQGRALIGTRAQIADGAWRALLAAPEGTPMQVTVDAAQPYVFSRFAITAGQGAPTPWHAVSALPLSAALVSLHPFRRNLLVWGGGITLLLALTGFATLHHMARYQLEHRRHLREQDELLSAAINSAGDAIVSVDPAGRIAQFNPAASRIFGHPTSHILGKPLSTLLPKAQHLDSLQHAEPSTGPTGLGRVAGVRADGQALELEASVSQMTVHGARMVTAILRDVTERVRTERALAQHQLALSELTHRLLQQEKQTTRRLAQTLHDQLGQTVGAMRLSYDALINLLPGPMTPKLHDRSRVLGQLIDTATAQVRQALVALRPPLLDEVGLLAALQHEVQARAVDAEPVVLRLDVAPHAAGLRWPADVEHAAFMVAREALANALLHASARTVVLRVEGHDDLLRLSVTDDGVGLNPDMARGRPGHLGIVGMRERALAIGAQLQAHGLPKGGSTVSLHWAAAQHTLLSQCQTQDADCANQPHHE